MPRTVRKAAPEWEQVFTGTIPKEVGAAGLGEASVRVRTDVDSDVCKCRCRMSTGFPANVDGNVKNVNVKHLKMMPKTKNVKN